MEIFLWLLALGGFASLCGAAWLWGYTKSHDRTVAAETKEKQEALLADAKTTEAEIGARPKPDTWDGSVTRL